MEHTERESIVRASTSNPELKRLYERHQFYELHIGKLGKRPFLTSTEQIEFKRLKELKLRGVEKMLRLIAGCQAAA